MILAGDLDADAAVFADTGWEPHAVYQHLEALKIRADAHGFPIHIVNAGEKLPALVPPTENVIERWLKSVWNVPYWSENENRSVGLSL